MCKKLHRETQIKRHSKRRTAVINGQKILLMQNLGQILTQKA